ncbi:MAG TPA: alpha/beta hydrolase, partial [Solirubrobacteraceae bacterium]
GVVAMRFALEHPERTASLILLDGGGVKMTALRLRMVVGSLVVINALMGRPAVVRALVRRPWLRRAAMAGFVRDPAVATAALAHEMLSIFAGPGLVDAVMSAARDDVGEYAERIAAPTLLIWGDRDPVVPLSAAQRLAARLPRARLTTVPGVGHCPMLEQPDRFNDLVADWVDERPGT